MSPRTSPVRIAARTGRRVKGLAQMSRIRVTGDAPTAVTRALGDALAGRFSADEREWIHRIEALRSLLALSPETFEMIDYGAGTRADPTSGMIVTTERTIGQMTTFSKSPMWSKLLFKLVRELKPMAALELGACVGISGAFLAAAIELNGNDGRLVSVEGVPALAERSRRSIEELGLARLAEVRAGEFDTSLPSALEDLAPVEVAFVDGNHQELATLSYADRILDHCSNECLFVFDDIDYDDGMKRAWRQITQDDRFALTIDLRSVGLAVVSQTAATKRHLRMSYY